ncbi:hypothetical protein GNI_133640 [Gregarina niphandrodes]|uniref:Uncharacterized protein n=1 Tax=Gregarina niphandrodes TaxID=110365 RepID=A0A023B140_GRENI|nr:hypothetical protein GNI_133640 [Gregarina niphandrodes]EZG46523.1 hypothetical protein GNI_133640 [Gregarina niphandrodes]|eukprot:XP_011132296.1 hypothetical protein GNI_133640 [Gregarina niphandrodes]
MQHRLHRGKTPSSSVLTTILLSCGGKVISDSSASLSGSPRYTSSSQEDRPVVPAENVKFQSVSNAARDLAPNKRRAVKRCPVMPSEVTGYPLLGGSTEDALPPKRMCLESAIGFLDQASAMSDDAIAKIDSVVAEVLEGWDEGDDVIADIDGIVEDMLGGCSDALFGSAKKSNAEEMGDKVCVGVNEYIPAFQITFPHEDASSVEAKYLVWAYDILSHGWWHLVPFQVKKPISVFGLARNAIEWEEARKANPALKVNVLLEARCYCPSRKSAWDTLTFSKWLKSRQSASDIGFRKMCGKIRRGGWFILSSRVSDAQHDLLTRWPVNQEWCDQFAENMRRWRCRYTNAINRGLPDLSACLSWLQFEELVVKRMGDLRVPLNEVSKEYRKTERRQLMLLKMAELTGGMMNDASLVKVMMSNSPPSHLVNISGSTCQVVTETETAPRIPSRYLVWAYDILNHGWWGAVPKTILSPGLSVFELAQKAWEWETNGGSIYTLSSSCYTCGEGGKPHMATESCERCEESWSFQEFWEWLRLRHFHNIYDQLKNLSHSIKDSRRPQSQFLHWEKRDRHWLLKTADEIGFEIPVGKDDSRFEMIHESLNKLLPTTDNRSLAGRFAMRRFRDGIFRKSPNGLYPWEHERLIVHRISSYYTHQIDPSAVNSPIEAPTTSFFVLDCPPLSVGQHPKQTIPP